MLTNPTRTVFTPEVIFTSSDDLAPPTTLLKARSVAKRKFSFPATLHSSSLLCDSNPIGRTSRRLSNVSDRVSDRVRKLSTAIGWHHSPSKAILIEQGKFLITLYIRFRLKRSGVLNQQKKKIGLQKMQRNLLIGADVKDVFTALKEAATVLEAMHSKIYTNVSRQLSSSPMSACQENPEDTAVLITTFGRILFKSSNEITWGKVISLFSVTAGLSIDLVRQNHEEHIPTLIEGFLGVIEDELIPFLSEHNGWISLHNKLQNKSKASTEWSLIVVLLAIFVFFFLLNNYLLKF